MNKNITLTHDGKKYKLEFTRASAKMFEDMGFSPQDIYTRPNSAVIPFVWCAFKANHASINQKKAEQIYNAVPKDRKGEFLGALISMYTDTYTSLLGGESDGDEADEGNVTWEQSWSDDSE